MRRVAHTHNSIKIAQRYLATVSRLYKAHNSRSVRDRAQAYRRRAPLASKNGWRRALLWIRAVICITRKNGSDTREKNATPCPFSILSVKKIAYTNNYRSVSIPRRTYTDADISVGLRFLCDALEEFFPIWAASRRVNFIFLIRYFVFPPNVSMLTPGVDTKPAKLSPKIAVVEEKKPDLEFATHTRASCIAVSRVVETGKRKYRI